MDELDGPLWDEARRVAAEMVSAAAVSAASGLIEADQVLNAAADFRAMHNEAVPYLLLALTELACTESADLPPRYEHQRKR